MSTMVTATLVNTYVDGMRKRIVEVEVVLGAAQHFELKRSRLVEQDAYPSTVAAGGVRFSAEEIISRK